MSSNILKGPTIDFAVSTTIGQLLFHSAQRHHHKICQIDASQDHQETYASIRLKSTRIAIELNKRGVISNDLIGICTNNTLEAVPPLLAVLYLGAKVCNFDGTQSVRQVTHLLSLVKPKILFLDGSAVELMEESLGLAKLTSQIIVFSDYKVYDCIKDLLGYQPREASFRPKEVDVHDVAVIFFSSGTTGMPKAICHSHYSFLNTVFATYISGAKYDCFLSFTSFYWISSLLFLILSFIDGGTRIYLPIMEAESTLQAIEKYQITVMFLSPLLTYKLTDVQDWGRYDTSSISSLLIGGGPIGGTHYQRLEKMFKNGNVVFVYGLTEGGVVTLFDPTREKSLMERKRGSTGKPAPNLTIKIVDVMTRQGLGPNQKGEICFKAPSVMTGYYQQNSSEAFDNDNFLKTGDIGYYDSEHCFYVIERIKEMFKYLSLHVVPSAIEAVLLEHPGVAEAIVFGSPGSVPEGEVPTACVVKKPGSSASESEIEDFVARHVADYEKLRGGVTFVDVMLKTPSGKIMRKEMRAQHLKL